MFNRHVDIVLPALESAIVDYYAENYGRGVPAIVRGMIRRHFLSQKKLDWADLKIFANEVLKESYEDEPEVIRTVSGKLEALEAKAKGKKVPDSDLTGGRDETNLTEGAGRHTVYLSPFELILVQYRKERTGNKITRAALICKIIATHALYDNGLKVRSLGSYIRKREEGLDGEEREKLGRQFEIFKRGRKKLEG